MRESKLQIGVPNLGKLRFKGQNTGRQAFNPPKIRVPGSKPRLSRGVPKMKGLPNIRGLGGL